MRVPYLKRADNGVYYIHETDERGRNKRNSTRTRDLAEAKSVLGEWLLLSAQEREKAAKGATIAELWDLYEKKHVEKHCAAADTARFSWNNLKPHFGEMTAAQVTQDAVDLYVQKRASGRIGRPSKTATCRREIAQLIACLGFHKIPVKLKLPADGSPRDRWLRTEEIGRLMAAAKSLRPDDAKDRLTRAERFLWLALETAGRREAILELTWDRVDFETNVIDLNVPGRKRTKKRRAVVPISKSLRPVLEQAWQERSGDLVVGGAHGINKAVATVAKAAGLAGVSPHVLRHTAATHMARKGVSLFIVSKVLANTEAMVEKVYAKHCPDDLRAAVETISGAIGAAA